LKFWEHALGCAVASKIIARRVGNQNSEEAFIAGLVHDIGKIVIDQYLNEDFQKICALVETGAARMIDAELQVLGVSHAQIGGWLARKWNLPKPLLQTIIYHHQPNLAGPDTRIASIIHLGNGLARLAQIGSGGDNLPPVFHASIWPVLGLDESQVPALIEEIAVDYANSTDFLHALQE